MILPVQGAWATTGEKSSGTPRKRSLTEYMVTQVTYLNLILEKNKWKLFSGSPLRLRKNLACMIFSAMATLVSSLDRMEKQFTTSPAGLFLKTENGSEG